MDKLFLLSQNVSKRGHFDEPIIPVLITAATAIGAVFLREWLVNKLAERKNRKTAIWMVRIFLLKELEENFQVYTKVIINNFSLGNVLESNWYESSGKDSPSIVYGHHRMSQYNFSVEVWEKQKNELVKLDFELTKQLASVYRRFELLKRYADENYMLSDVIASPFMGMTDEFTSLIKRINEAP